MQKKHLPANFEWSIFYGWNSDMPIKQFLNGIHVTFASVAYNPDVLFLKD